MPADLAWLNGWPRMGLTGVLIGTCVHCIGCGELHGVTSVAFTEDWSPPAVDPAYPFRPGDCPVCVGQAKYSGEVVTIFDVAMSEIQPGQEWLLEGKWVRVVRVLARGPAERVSVTYEQDGEQETTREFRGFERAAVR